MNKADYQQQSLDSTQHLEEKIDKLAAELVKIRVALSALSFLPEKLAVENLSVGQIDFHLDNLNIHEVSGALNIGITSGVNLGSTPKQQYQEIAKQQAPKASKDIVQQESPQSGPGCKIHFSR